jgi:alpha-N-acetylglucosaminidase
LIQAGEPFLEDHAAREFAKYASQITGSEPATAAPGVFNLESGQVRVLVGHTGATRSLADQGVLRVPGDLGEDGFLIRSLQDGGQRYLVLLGASPRATLYAVYHYLEKSCRVGFFSDGERVPRLDRMPTDGLDLTERPRWPMREYMMDCEYTSYWWGHEEWKQEVDWATKHKFNVLSSNFDYTATWRKVWKRFGVDVPPGSLSAPPFHPWAGWHNWAIHPPYPEAFQNTQADLAKRFVQYGRSLGIKMAPDFRGFLGQVPRDFYRKYRDRARFIEVGWVGFDPPGVFIHPADPLYAEVAKAFAEEFVKDFGTDHLWPGQTFCEMEPAKDRAETLAIEIAMLKRDLEAIRAVDPKAVLFTNSWTFLARSSENVRAFLKALPDDAVQVWEMPSDLVRGKPQYQQLDYFHGKPWLFGFLYAYGGTTMLHGDLADLIKRAKDVAADPKAGKCLGMAIQPEALHHNPIAFDLLSRAGWNPSPLDLNGFLEDYAIRRYGKDAAPKMVECFKELSASAYGQPGVECPLYMLRITSDRMRAKSPHGEDQAVRFLPHLRKALEAALSESSRLASSPLYQHDVVDIGRQYLSDLFNVHAARLARAFEAKDRQAFEREAAALRQVLASQEMLLSSSDAYCLAPLLAKAKALPGAPENYDERIRDILTVWGGKIIDYAHRDYYELVRFYYGKRVEAFLEHAQKRLGQPLTPADDQQLGARYHEIEQAWVKQPFRVADSEWYAGGPVKAAAQILQKHRSSD